MRRSSHPTATGRVRFDRGRGVVFPDAAHPRSGGDPLGGRCRRAVRHGVSGHGDRPSIVHAARVRRRCRARSPSSSSWSSRRSVSSLARPSAVWAARTGPTRVRRRLGGLTFIVAREHRDRPQRSDDRRLRLVALRGAGDVLCGPAAGREDSSERRRGADPVAGRHGPARRVRAAGRICARRRLRHRRGGVRSACTWSSPAAGGPSMDSAGRSLCSPCSSVGAPCCWRWSSSGSPQR